MKKILGGMSLSLVLLAATGDANATLITSGSVEYGGTQRNLIYDTDLNITWLDYSRDLDTWYNQQSWAASLSLTINGITYANWRLPFTVDGQWVWGDDGTTTAGYNITTSEMGHLYYVELGNQPGPYQEDGEPLGGDYIQNTGPFQFLAHEGFWSATEYGARLPPEYQIDLKSAWAFMMSDGYQTVDPKDGSPAGNYAGGGHMAMAVMSGQIQTTPVPDPTTPAPDPTTPAPDPTTPVPDPAAPVPEPTTLLLFGAGLTGLIGSKIRCRKKA